MRIYLSDYWKKNLIVGIAFAFIIVISTGIFCVWNYDEEDYILLSVLSSLCCSFVI